MGGVKRILMVTALGYMPERVGGAQISMHEMCLELRARGVEVAALCATAGDTPADQVAFAEYGGYRVYRARRPVAAMRAVCRDFKPDAAVVQGGAMAPLVAAVLKEGVPAVAKFVDCEFKDGNLFAPGSRCLFLGNSPFTRRRAEVLLGVTCHLVPSAIRVADYVTEAAAGGRGHVLFVGSSPLKGIEIAFKLAEERPEIPFLFVESWPITEETRAVYLARAARAGNIEWSRPVADMCPFYARARLLLAPSVWNDSAPRVVAEAQASAIPVLASDIAGLPYMVGPGGRLVETDAPTEAWLKALDEMWRDEKVYAELSQAARTHAFRPEVSPERAAETLLSLVGDYVTGGE
jgi:glycosyltransferase involved in cell wall biosynthesis